jgi:regulator of sirC expression with transglutaminase-like and TPR domain
MTHEEALENYQNLVGAPESGWDVFALALEIFRLVQPGVDLEPSYSLVSQIEEDIRAILVVESDTFSVIDTINEVLYGQYLFRGNVEDYFNPENSYLPVVLEKRLGVPITLCILYKEVARRLRLSLDNAAMPGHFLLRVRLPGKMLYLDAFRQGQLLLPEECLEMMKKITGRREDTGEDYLRPASNRRVVLRLLMNLKQLYKEKGQASLLLGVIERRIPLLADPLPEILERGLTKLAIEDYQGALADLRLFSENTPDSQMRDLIALKLRQIEKLARGN